jgi:hypothetical protein
MLKKPRLYWFTKIFISFFMLFSAYYTFSHPADFEQLGFPNYFRIELSVAKVIGALLLLVPAIPFRVRDWIYAGFIITMVSALIAHSPITFQSYNHATPHLQRLPRYPYYWYNINGRRQLCRLRHLPPDLEILAGRQDQSLHCRKHFVPLSDIHGHRHVTDHTLGCRHDGLHAPDMGRANLVPY